MANNTLYYQKTECQCIEMPNGKTFNENKTKNNFKNKIMKIKWTERII